MKYQNPKFTVGAPDSTDGLGCPRCALGPKWGEHVPGCRMLLPLAPCGGRHEGRCSLPCNPFEY
jgi:hypothetical protein